MTDAARQPHVRAEVRTVYRTRNGRAYRLSNSAAYLLAAKRLIGEACGEDGFRRLELADECPEACSKGSTYKCRFHRYTEPEQVYLGHGEYDITGGGMLYYVKVLPRLARFLRFVDERSGNDD